MKSRRVFQLSTIDTLLKSDPVNMVDVGAAGGIHPLFGSESSTGLFRYFGFEPNPKNYAALPKDEYTVYHELALSNKIGRISFNSRGTVSSIEDRTDRERMYGETYSSIEVNVETLANLREQKLLPRIDVLKTDAERHDYSVLLGLEGVGGEPLCVIAEYEYYATDAGSFSDIDKLLTKNGMLLFSLAQKNGNLGELAGGDLLYLRDVGSILATTNREQARIQTIKLFTISVMLNYVQYAFIVARAAHEKGLLSEAEHSELSSYCRNKIFIPFALPRLPGMDKLAHFLVLIAVLLSGSPFGSKSAPRFNRLAPSSRLILSRRLLLPSWRRRYDAKLEKGFQMYKALQGMFFHD